MNNAFEKELNKSLNKVRCSKSSSRTLPSRNNINLYRQQIALKKRNLSNTLNNLIKSEILEIKKALRKYYYKTYFTEPVNAVMTNGKIRTRASIKLPRLLSP